MMDQRQHPRHPVSWPIRLWFGDTICLSGRALDASARGMFITLCGHPPDVVAVGESCQLSISAGPRVQLACPGEIRNVRASGIGLVLPDGLFGQAAMTPNRPMTAVQALSALATRVTAATHSLSAAIRPSVGGRLAALAVEALHEAVAGEWVLVRQTLDELRTLIRFVVRFDELSVEECTAVKDLTALGSILIIDDTPWGLEASPSEPSWPPVVGIEG